CFPFPPDFTPQECVDEDEDDEQESQRARERERGSSFGLIILLLLLFQCDNHFFSYLTTRPGGPKPGPGRVGSRWHMTVLSSFSIVSLLVSNISLGRCWRWWSSPPCSLFLFLSLSLSLSLSRVMYVCMSKL